MGGSIGINGGSSQVCDNAITANSTVNCVSNGSYSPPAAEGANRRLVLGLEVLGRHARKSQQVLAPVQRRGGARQ